MNGKGDLLEKQASKGEELREDTRAAAGWLRRRRRRRRRRRAWRRRRGL
jgi:hypothetical protein